MSKIGYARVSTSDQNLSRQLEALKQEDCSKIFSEKISGKNMERPELKNMLNYIRDDDTVVIVSLDRISRNYDDIKTIVEDIKKKGAKLSVLDLPQTNTGNDLTDKFMLDMMINLMSFVAENERTKIKDRQAQGIAIAKKKGIYKGRKPKYTDDNATVRLAIRLFKENTPKAQIAKECNMSRNTLYKILRENHLMESAKQAN